MKNIEMVLKVCASFIICCAILCCSSCVRKTKKARPAYYEIEYPSEDTYYDAIIPYRDDCGVKYVNVSVNGTKVEMIFDTGCSGTLINPTLAYSLYEAGQLSDEDILGYSQSMIANGTIEENVVINLSEVLLGDIIYCRDVEATVSNSINAPLLLGNEVLNRTVSYTIDNEAKSVKFKIR